MARTTTRRSKRNETTEAQAAETEAQVQDNGADTTEAETTESPSPEIDNAVDDAMTEPGEAIGVWELNETAAGEALREIFGSSKIEFTIFDYDDGSFTAQLAFGDDVYNSDAEDGSRYPSATAAAANALRKVPEVYDRDIKVQESRIDFQYERPASGDNAPDIEPWAEGQPDADELRKLGAHIAEGVAKYQDNMKQGRGAMLAASRDISTAREMIAARSKTKKKGVNKDYWGDYVREFFPAFLDAFPGKNAVSEAAELGSAPDAVIDLWPEGQSSPKSFQGWINGARTLIKETASAVILKDTKAAIEEWNNSGRPEGEAPSCPGREAIRAAMENETIINALDDRKQLAIRAAANFQKNKPGDDWQKNLQEQRKKERDYQAAKVIANWKFSGLPEGDAIDTNAIFKAIQKQVTADYKAALETQEERTEKVVEQAAKQFSEAFHDKDVDVAARHLLNILVAHHDAEDVLETLNAMFDQRQADAKAGAETDEEAADADADGDAVDETEEAEGDETEAAAE